MQVLKTFMKVTKKRIPVASIYIIIFIVIGFLMSTSAAKTNSFEATKLDVSVIDEDNSDASKALMDYIGTKHKIVDIENDKDEILDSLFYQRVDYILTIQDGYAEKIADGQTDDLFTNYKMPNSYSGEFLDSQLNQYIVVLSAYLAGGMSLDDALEKASEMSDSNVEVETLNFSKNANVEYSDTMSYYYQFLAYILIAVIITGLCPTLLVFTQNKIKNRTNCSSLSSSKQLTQIAAGTAVFVVGVYLLLTVAAVFLFGSDMFNEKGLLAMLNGFIFLIFAMMLTLLIAILAPNTNVVTMIANTISLGMSFLCGVFVPQSMMSDMVLSIGKFLPAYWYIKANDMLAGTSGEMFEIKKYMTYLGVELAFSVAIFCVILLISKTRRTSRSI